MTMELQLNFIRNLLYIPIQGLLSIKDNTFWSRLSSTYIHKNFTKVQCNNFHSSSFRTIFRTPRLAGFYPFNKRVVTVVPEANQGQ